ncbi:ABC transporter permease subunit [uncultured Sphingomonas sp.]|uniref:ABC transporter permease subunit n=1 Tax=uncultured Sphingomonas sp. TaxID=158754 RepID=UPI0035CB32F8
MSAVLASARVEFRIAWRSGVALALALLALALVVTAGIATAERQSATARTQAAAERLDAATFLSQKLRNPHAVAHFSRYAVRPADPLGWLDSGAAPYQGAAVWMEAHKQNPANFRPAEDRATPPFGLDISPAWVFATLLPLIAMLLGHGAFAAARERGTLDLELTSAGGVGSLALGKLAAQATMVLVPTALLAASIAGVAATQSLFPDALARAAAWVGIVTLYGAIFVLAGLAVSARSATVRGALATILAIWVISVAIVPRVAASAAELIAPLPMGQAFTTAMRDDVRKAVDADRQATGIGLPGGPKTVVVDGRLLNGRGVALTRGEAAGNRVHEAAARRLAEAQDRQEGVRLAIGALSPTTAFRALSASLAAADLAHQRDFATQAEATRRRIIAFLNGDQTLRGGDRGADYVNGPRLWRDVPRFDYRAPALTDLHESFVGAAGILALWAVLAGLALWIGIRRMERPR